MFTSFKTFAVCSSACVLLVSIVIHLGHCHYAIQLSHNSQERLLHGTFVLDLVSQLIKQLINSLRLPSNASVNVAQLVSDANQ